MIEKLLQHMCNWTFPELPLVAFFFIKQIMETIKLWLSHICLGVFLNKIKVRKEVGKHAWLIWRGLNED